MVMPVGRHVDARPSPAGLTRTNKWVTLFIVGIGVFMSTLDTSIVNISLPTIARYYGVALSGTVEWVIIAYLVVIAAVLLTVGRISDVIGRKPLWLLGLSVFTGGSFLCGLSPSLYLLVAARGLQGLGAAMLFAVSPAMLTGAFPREERGRALGMNAVVVALGTSVGPTLGGIITQHFSWRWIFFVNVPLGLIGLGAAVWLLHEQVQRKKAEFDPSGAVCLAVGLAALTLGLSFGEEWGWSSPALICTLTVAIVALFTTVAVESRVSHPIIDLNLLRNRVFASANLSLLLSFLALFAVSFMMPFYYEQLRNYDPQESGLLLTPLPLTIAVLAPFSGALADRIGTRALAAVGLSVACAGLVVLSGLSATSSLWAIAWRLVVVGAGQAIFQSPNNSALMGSAPRDEQGQAAGFLATGRVIGQSMSVAIAGAVLGITGATSAGLALMHSRGAHAAAGPGATALQNTFMHGFHTAFLVCAALAAIGIFTSLARGQESRRR